MAVYAWTAAPNVTMKDAGELIVAAVHVGVPHPTGYPLWTFLAGLFTLLPLGSAAWEVNLFSGVCAAFSTAVLAALICHLGRRLGRTAPVAGAISVAVSLVFAFSVCVWSQSVFAEVYTLHIAVAALLWWALYRWWLDPGWRRGFLVCVFLLALGMSNHHLMLALAPLPLLLAFLVRRPIAGELAAYCGAAGALLFIGFGALSGQATLWETALRTGQLAVVAVIVLALLRPKLAAWKTGLWILPVALLGLVPYLYMPLASSTNPPMNWGYTRTADGFFYSVNRSPYRGRLTQQLQGTLGRLVGTSETRAGDGDEGTPTLGERLKLLGAFAWRYLAETTESFTSLTWVLALAALWLAYRPPSRAGPLLPWISMLTAGFLLSAFFQPASAALAGSATRLEWNLQMPYLGYSYLPLALLAGLGACALAKHLEGRETLVRGCALAGIFVLPVVALARNHETCSQRGHWFGWEYGKEMMDPLPPGAVLFGGTDAGRFIPTYMIFGESFEKPRHKRDPAFDRRDVYLITQTQLVARFYRSYIRDHYGAERPAPGFVGRLLGRHRQYPAKPLELPSEEDVAELIQELRGRGEELKALGPRVAEWIFLENRDEHEFFVEEALLMEWAIPYAIPAGPLYRLAREPLEELAEADVEADRAYWRRTSERLWEHPQLSADLDARLAFQSLRLQGAMIYHQRGMAAEAEAAYRQALKLLPAELNTLARFGEFLAQNGRRDEALELFSEFEAKPQVLQVAEEILRRQRALLEGLGAAHAQLLINPSDDRAFQAVLAVALDKEGDPPHLQRLRDDLIRWREDPSDPVVFRRMLASYRAWNLHGLADHLALEFLERREDPRALQLILADQKTAKKHFDEFGTALRLELARRTLGAGEAELSLSLLRSEPWSDETVAALRQRARNLLASQRDLEPVIPRLAASQTSVVLGREVSAVELGGRDPIRELNTVIEALAGFQARPGSPQRLDAVVEAYRRLRLPGLARALLLEQGGAPEAVLARAVHWASRDLQPTELGALAEALEGRGPESLQALEALTTFYWVTDQLDPMQGSLLEIQEREGREGMMERLRRNPLLEPLTGDSRFLEVLDRALGRQGGSA